MINSTVVIILFLYVSDFCGKGTKKDRTVQAFEQKLFRILQCLTFKALKRYFGFVTNPVLCSTKKTSYSSRARRHHNDMKKQKI